MILAVIVLILLGQVSLYLLMDRFKIRLGKAFIVVAVLILYFFVLPPCFYPESDPDPDAINCGMPLLGINLAFWIIGGGGALFAHFIYYLISYLRRKKAKVN